jgi:oxalate decarboxylase/phosphoglucose isomerase-like protein (cupin superfamily)
MIKGQKIELKVNTYKRWVEKQNIPVIQEYYIRDLKQVPVADWAFKGAKGAILNLIGTEDSNDAYILEIPPGGSIKPQRTLFEEFYLCVDGNGSSTVWNNENKKINFEWSEGSLFSPPVNTWRQHFNGSGDKPARFLVVTSAPILFNLFRNEKFIFNTDFNFEDRFDEEPDSFSGTGVSYPQGATTVWDTNFVADVRSIQLHRRNNRGAGGSFLGLEMSENQMTAHISEMPVGTYKKAHRHGAGAHVVIIGGQGYSLMWPQGEPMQVFPWEYGSVVVPPDMWFHQHFNTGPEPARYLAIRWGARKFVRATGRERGGTDVSLKEGGHQIEYADEDPKVREMFEAELAKNGVKSRMDDVFKLAS